MQVYSVDWETKCFSMQQLKPLHKTWCELKLDISLLEDRSPRKKFTYRDFEFDVFNINEPIASIAEVRKFVPNLWTTSKIIKALYRVKRKLTGRDLYSEKTKYRYEDRIKQINDNTYLYGYFQTAKYFDEIRNELLNNFSLRGEINDANRLLINQMKNENAVSIHIRRGDYKQSPFKLLDIENYYLPAIEFIKQKVDNPVFYIFTNDYSWTEENFSSIDIKKTIVNINTDSQSYMDMILMSRCKHNICANSSFSWWGAWLNTNIEKIVIAPTSWFKEDIFDINSCDLIPSDWIKI